MNAELDTLNSQLAPAFPLRLAQHALRAHRRGARLALDFDLHLAKLGRYLLQRTEHDLVPPSEELASFAECVELARIRHRDSH